MDTLDLWLHVAFIVVEIAFLARISYKVSLALDIMADARQNMPEDIVSLVNDKLAGGAVGAVGELVKPILSHIGKKIDAGLKERAAQDAVKAAVPNETTPQKVP